MKGSKSTNRLRSPDIQPGDKCFELYSMARKGQKDKTDKTAQEYEFEKAKEECTFQPSINRTKTKKAKVGGVNDK
jgi:hypothetical protein